MHRDEVNKLLLHRGQGDINADQMRVWDLRLSAYSHVCLFFYFFTCIWINEMIYKFTPWGPHFHLDSSIWRINHSTDREMDRRKKTGDGESGMTEMRMAPVKLETDTFNVSYRSIVFEKKTCTCSQIGDKTWASSSVTQKEEPVVLK